MMRMDLTKRPTICRPMDDCCENETVNFYRASEWMHIIIIIFVY